MEKTCKTCKWFEELPFVDTGICVNDASDYGHCPIDYMENDTCKYWEEKE